MTFSVSAKSKLDLYTKEKAKRRKMTGDKDKETKKRKANLKILKQAPALCWMSQKYVLRR